jgi:hypothetical protein
LTLMQPARAAAGAGDAVAAMAAAGNASPAMAAVARVAVSGVSRMMFSLLASPGG